MPQNRSQARQKNHTRSHRPPLAPAPDPDHHDLRQATIPARRLKCVPVIDSLLPPSSIPWQTSSIPSRRAPTNSRLRGTPRLAVRLPRRACSQTRQVKHRGRRPCLAHLGIFVFHAHPTNFTPFNPDSAFNVLVTPLLTLRYLPACPSW